MSIIINSVMCLKNSDTRGKEVRTNGEYKSNLRFADDFVIIAKEEDDLIDMLSVGKTKIMLTEMIQRYIKIEGKQLKKVEEIIYMGHTIPIIKGTEQKVNRCLAVA